MDQDPPIAPRASGKDPQPKRVAIESLTSAEATWHVVILVVFVAAYLFAAAWARYSAVLGCCVVLAAVAASAAGLPWVTKAVRAEALHELREAAASGDACRLREA